MDNMVPVSTTPEEKAEAEECLRFFRTRYLSFFPCIYISEPVTAEQLRAERPFLWLAIMTVACQAAHRQLALGDTMQHIVAQKTLIEHEKNMDLVNGLIIFLGW